MIRSYFNATADRVKKKIDVDGYGEPMFDTIDENVDCRKIETNALVRNDEGNEVVASIEVWLPPEYDTLPPESEIVFNGQAKTVIKSGHKPGLVADQYLKVFLK